MSTWGLLTPEQTFLYQVVEQRYPAFRDIMGAQGRTLPVHVQQEFSGYLKCGRLEHGFLRVQCSEYHQGHLVAFSCNRREFCPSCGARRMAESAAPLVDEVLPEQPIRQWVLSIPFQLRFLFTSRSELMGRVLGIIYRAISTHLIQKTGFTRKTAQTGAVTLIQRFASALNLNVHFHMLPRRSLHRNKIRKNTVSARQRTRSAGIGGVGAYDQPPGGQFSRMQRHLGTG